MKLGLSLLCEHPDRKTGLTSLFTQFVREALRCYDDVEFVLFCAEGQQLGIESPRLSYQSGYTANNHLLKRLIAEHFLIGPAAAALGCDLLITTGLVPLWGRVPVAMQLFTLHHLTAGNRTGGWRSLYRTWATRSGLSKAKLVITNTRFACAQILTEAPDAAPRLLQSYEGMDHTLLHPDRTDEAAARIKARFGLEPDYFFWCSNFYPYKQAELMMEAWCGLPVELRERHPMVMVGGSAWGDSKDRTLEIARQCGAADQVKTLGWVSDEELPLLFRFAAVFVHPSREETFGRSVLEAMASGVPCVVQGIPVMHEVTAGHALLIDYHDRPAATEALRQALLDSSVRETLIPGGIARAAEFSFERLTVERVEALRAVLGLPATAQAAKYPPVYADSFPTLPEITS